MQLCSEGAPAGALIISKQTVSSCTVLLAPPQAHFPKGRAYVQKGGRLLPLVHDSTFPAGQYEGARPRQSTCHVRTKGSSHRAQCAQPQPLLSAQWEALQSRTAFLLVAGCEGKPSTEPWQKQCAKLLFPAAPAPRVLFMKPPCPQCCRMAQNRAQDWQMGK